MTAVTALLADFGMPPAATEQAVHTASLWRIFLFAGLAVAAIVYGLIFWSVWKHRRRRTDAPDARGASFRENIRLEIIYTTIPVIIVVVLFAVSVSGERAVTAVSEHPDLIVQTEAFDWGWRFTYPRRGGADMPSQPISDVVVVSQPVGDALAVGGGPELVLPVGETTRIELTSNDAIHAFWVPGFLFKRDAIPGHPTQFDITPTTISTYQGKCAELCGWNHAYMTFTVKVVSPEAYRAWWVANQAPNPIPPRDIFCCLPEPTPTSVPVDIHYQGPPLTSPSEVTS